MRTVGLLAAAALSMTPATCFARSAQYAAVQQRLQRGWNSWDTHSVAAQVLAPAGLEIRLGVKKVSAENTDAFLDAPLIGRRAPGDEQVIPGPHTFDGSYTELELVWRGVRLRLQTAHADGDLVMLATPLARQTAGSPSTRIDTFLAASDPTSQPPVVVFSAGMVWNRPGAVARHGARLVAQLPDRTVPIYAVGRQITEPHLPVLAPRLAFRLDEPVGVSTGRPRSLQEVQAIIAQARARFADRATGGGPDEVRAAIETVVGWDTIYDPEGKRVISPVSRIWNENWGGYVLFEWDTFFAAELASVGDRDLAYANALEILNETTPAGFAPNYARAGGWKSGDRSEPPVGAITVLALYHRFGDRWFLEDAYERLMRWNRWWPAHRELNGYLVWGSDGHGQPRDPDDPSAGTLQGARYESGLDNSPMYDGVGFDGQHMELADVGLMSLYIADCDALSSIAETLRRTADVRELRSRAARYRAALATLWDPATGIYRNKDLRTGRLSKRISPTNFYPLLARAPTPAQADAMISNHLLNPQEFWGARVIPSVPRDDPAFADQDYWRGRIWGPMNYLVWLGLGNYDTVLARDAREQLSSRSMALFLDEWRTKGHVHENYSATGPDSDTVVNSDRFYHWGALLGLIGPGVLPASPAADASAQAPSRPSQNRSVRFAPKTPLGANPKT